jgi:hypothetical protein
MYISIVSNVYQIQEEEEEGLNERIEFPENNKKFSS